MTGHRGRARRTARRGSAGHSRSLAEARQLGLTFERTQAHDLVTSFHCVGVPAELADDHLAQLRAIQRVTPTAAFNHQTAAAQWRLPLPMALRRLHPIHQTVPADHHRVEHRNVVGHVSVRHIVRRASGLLVTTSATPGATWHRPSRSASSSRRATRS